MNNQTLTLAESIVGELVAYQREDVIALALLRQNRGRAENTLKIRLHAVRNKLEELGRKRGKVKYGECREKCLRTY